MLRKRERVEELLIIARPESKDKTRKQEEGSQVKFLMQLRRIGIKGWRGEGGGRVRHNRNSVKAEKTCNLSFEYSLTLQVRQTVSRFAR